MCGEEKRSYLKQKELTSPTEGASQPAAVPTSRATLGYPSTVSRKYLTQMDAHLTSSPWNLRGPATDTSEKHNLEKRSLGRKTDSSSSKLLLLSKPQFPCVPNGNQTHRIVVKNKIMHAHCLKHNIHFIKSNSCDCFSSVWSVFM